MKLRAIYILEYQQFIHEKARRFQQNQDNPKEKLPYIIETTTKNN